MVTNSVAENDFEVADYFAMVIFLFILLLLMASTGYEVYQTVILGNNPKCLNKLFKSFSIITNTREFVKFPIPSDNGDIECLHGVRSLSMMLIIVYHSFSSYISCKSMTNPKEFQKWMISPQAVWIVISRISVETFFMISGLLVVYTTTSKLTRSQFLMSLHMFYLNRWLRLFPILAAVVLIQVSILRHISYKDESETCKELWWATLLYVQNLIDPFKYCLSHSWYLNVDLQLHILSPAVLFWVLGNRKRTAWIALAAALILSMAGATAYNFILNLHSTDLNHTANAKYFSKYYVNTLTRSSPFFIGMIYGYILHSYRHQKLQFSKVRVRILWMWVTIVLGAVTWINYLILQPDWDNQLMDNLINSFMRPCWALAVGWIILACHHGYGGPVNWLLCLRCFKLLSRLSYAMYMVHHPLIRMYHYSKNSLGQFSFSPTALYFEILVNIPKSVAVGFLMTVLLDYPCSTLIRHFVNEDKLQPILITN